MAKKFCSELVNGDCVAVPQRDWGGAVLGIFAISAFCAKGVVEAAQGRSSFGEVIEGHCFIPIVALGSIGLFATLSSYLLQHSEPQAADEL